MSKCDLLFLFILMIFQIYFSSPGYATFGQEKNKNMLLIVAYILVLNISLLRKHTEKNKSHNFDGFDISYSQGKKTVPS